MTRGRLLILPALLACAGILAGCGSDSTGDIQGWISDQRARLSPRVETLPQPRAFVPEPYTQASTLDPFSGQRLAQALGRDEALAAATSGLLAAEIQRRKEALEAYPLDAIALVGTLSRQGRLMALLHVDNRLYTVAPGQYLGQNYGKVLRITTSEVQIREVVRDPAGTWVERPITLKLQEKVR